MKVSNTRLTAVVAVIGTLLVSGCDSREDAGVKAIARFKDLTPPPFSDVVSHKTDIAQEWVKKDAFGTPQYTVMKTRQSPAGCESGNYYYIADMQQQTVQPLMASLCLADNITLSFRIETDSRTGEKSVVYSHDGKVMGKRYLPENQEKNQ
ncbi:YfjS/YafY family lipoprotein [Klebsiella aerogenes]